MKHPSVLELYNYWNKRRGQQAAPERSDVEPGAIPRALADAFVIAFDANAAHPFRIAGTRLCAAFGREVRGAVSWRTTAARLQPMSWAHPAPARACPCVPGSRTSG
jgi:hypothetical protein